MKMFTLQVSKALALALVVLSPLASTAKVTSTPMTLLKNTDAVSSDSQASRVSPTPPIREAKGKIVITKSTWKKIGNNYEEQQEIVCSQEVAVPVYEVDDSFEYSTSFPVQCDSKVGTEPVTVYAETSIFLMSGETDPNDPVLNEFPELIGKKMKAPIGALVVAPKDQATQVQSGASQFFSTLDLNLKSMLLAVRPSEADWNCPAGGSCAPKMTEYFAAVIHIQD